MKRSFWFTVLFISLLLSGLFLSGCSDNSVGSNKITANNLNMKISVTSLSMMDIVTQFRVIITAQDAETMVVPLEYDHGVITGTIENAPAGNAVVFLVEGLDSEGRVIYSGSDTITVVPDQENQLNISLTPAVSMIKLSPRYYQVSPGEPSMLDIKVFNVSNLNQISFRLFSSNGMFYPDSTKLSQQLLNLGNDLIFFDSLSYNPSYYALAFANGNELQTMVDANGDVTLGTIYFNGPVPELLPDSTIITFDSLTMYDNNGDPIATSDIYKDECFILIVESGDSIVTFPDPNLERVIRTTADVTTREIWLSDVIYLDILEADSMGITNLSGLEVCESLEEIYFAGNSIRDLTALGNLVNLFHIDLQDNQISNIQPLVNNEGIGYGDYLNLMGNPLDTMATNVYLPTLLERGVNVIYEY